MPAVIPWIPKSPPALVAPAPAAPCKASNLRVTHAPIFINGLAGSGYAGSVLIRNAGPACSLAGKPTVRFSGGPSARVRQSQEPLSRDIEPAVDVLDPPFSMRAVPTGKTVWLAVAWRSWCAATAPMTFNVILPSRGGTLHFFPGATPICQGKNGTSVVQTGTFMPYVAPPKQSTAIPLKATLGKNAYTAIRGTTLKYTVTLENQTDKPYRFGRCPVYVETVGAPANILEQHDIAKEIHYLNCRGVVVGAHSKVTFAMNLRIPRTLRKARLLEWQLDPHSYSAPFAPATVTLK